VSLYRLIDEESDRQPVSRLCRTLGVTRSGFYDWQRQPLSDRALADWLLTEQIRGIFDESEQTYGNTPRSPSHAGSQARDWSGAWAPSATRSTTRCANR
jgi:hypothetical protein